jgi:hypothetical protein
VGTESDLEGWLLNGAGDEAVIQNEVSRLTSWHFSGLINGIEKISTRVPGAAL